MRRENPNHYFESDAGEHFFCHLIEEKYEKILSNVMIVDKNECSLLKKSNEYINLYKREREREISKKNLVE